ncbi:lipid IV(A) 3-deoxy-D-manno-octulosonic acid transferase [Vibrio taketomensis]|uniref:lipid IV(A) 3-deoxy-D-manno-octulosonic acid transferase n=1 Tax=Vibrio taketomensis TaxID=2572923 RepID=UPI001389886C|nr:lipid IV(A) 3-deoxy-D-manno-octulosonic acid transferase [Vibrio taketomensis]
MLIRLLYSLLLAFLSPVLLYSLYKKKAGKPSFGPRWKEHFGFTPKTNADQPIWIHAVSVGEVIAAIPIIQGIKQQCPEQAIVVTTTTSTGAAQLSKLGELIEHRYMPIDFAWCVKGFLRQVKPAQLLIIETELWPNTLHCVAKAGIPISVLNARLSERSAKRYAKFQFIFNQLAQNLSQVLCQYSSDAERFIALGLIQQQVHVTGSVKFDISVPSSALEQGQALRAQIGKHRPVWVASSTHQGEDEIVLAAHTQLQQSLPNALLIIVPRHPERFEQVFNLANSFGFETVKRSSSATITNNTNVYIADTMGEMLTILASADICFMGGSLIGDKVGGHNFLEPAALSMATLTGPSFYNFAEIAHLLMEKQALSVCDNAPEISAKLTELFNHCERRLQMGQAALQVVESNRGALSKTLTLIRH